MRHSTGTEATNIICGADLRVDCGAGLQQSLAPSCRTIEAKEMAALALASSEADDVFEAVASHLRRPPFSRTLTAQDLRDGGET